MFKCFKGHAIALKELVLEFDPVQSQRVKEALESIHQQNNARSDHSKEAEPENYDEGCSGNIRSSSNTIGE